jgi:hypothetical protein
MQLNRVALIFFAVAAGSARADPPVTLDLRTGVYQDSDATFISTTTVAARGTVKDLVTVEARYLADVITSASIDVVTAATTAFHEVRHEAEGGLSYHDGTRTAAVGYIYSVENDWESHTINGGFSHDVARHNLTLGVAGTFVTNAVGRSGDANFHRSLTVGGGVASITATPGPRDLVSLSYTFSYLDGYQASPYRYVLFTDGSSRGAVPENDPQTRMRHAGTLRWNHHLFRDSVIQSSLRAYGDDWGILSLTAGLEYLVGFGDLTLGLHVRGYGQEHAAFYKPTYDGPELYMTADRELSTFLDVFGGVRIGWRRQNLGPLSELRAEAKVDGFYFWFEDFPRLRQRDGIVAELALGVSL